MRCLLTTLLMVACLGLSGQTNIRMTNLLADSVMRGLYDPARFAAGQVIDHPDSIALELQGQVSPDSLRAHLEALSGFGNRNTTSDTLSSTWGIGAARRWVHNRLAAYGAANGGRLLAGYLQFDRTICTSTQHRNVVAVLPGTDTSARGFVLLEAHLDSRCEGVCDPNCPAHGADDNGSGCALVMELARVMSGLSLRRTVVFMFTIAEEQGLYGAEAMSDYCRQEDIPIRCVLNNDVVGGILCGNTSSPPSCPGAGDIDSLNLRLFSYGGYNSPHKQLSRFNKLQYKEVMLPQVAVPMTLHIMSAEDRSGRGGDHIPFRQGQFTAMRFTSANEHGNASVGPGYTDHQHTSADSLGVDADHDGDLDTLWVDFNYLARNAVVNGCASSMAAQGPETPNFTATWLPDSSIAVEVLSQLQYGHYRLAVRSTSNDWDTLYDVVGSMDTIHGVALPQTLILSLASVDVRGIESLFSGEILLTPTGMEEARAFSLLQNRPNPFDESTTISVQLLDHLQYEEALILITDINGREIQRIPITLEAPMNEVLFQHGYHASGTYLYSLLLDGEVVATRKMIME